MLGGPPHTRNVTNDDAAGQPAGRVPGTRSPRRLSDARQAEVLDATLDLLARHGYGNLTMDAVAAAAHTSKATIYRQWGGKAGLVSAALGHLRKDESDAPPRDTGSLRGDLRWLAQTVGPTSEQQFTLMAALAHAARIDLELGAQLRSDLFDPSRTALEQILARAVERGEIPADHPALRHLPSVLISAGLSRPLVDGRLPDRAYFVRLIDDVVLPIFSLSRPGANPPTTDPPDIDPPNTDMEAP